MRAVPAGSRGRLTLARSCGAGSEIRTTRVSIGHLPVAAAERGLCPGVFGQAEAPSPVLTLLHCGLVPRAHTVAGVDPDGTMTRMSAESMRRAKHR